MASDDRPKLPRASLRGEKLYVEGEKEPYFQDRKETIYLRVDVLTVHRGYEPEVYRERTSKKALTEFLRGKARLENRDRFALIGLETDRNTPIEFSLGPISDTEAEHHWRAHIGFRPNDLEFDWEECFWVQGYCTRQYLDDLLGAIRRGHIDNIRVGMETTMWTRDQPSMYRRRPRTWHIAPPIDRESTDHNKLEQGNISLLTWEEKFGDHPANEAKEVTAPKPQLVDLPPRVYSMLTALVVMVAALLVLTFLR